MRWLLKGTLLLCVLLLLSGVGVVGYFMQDAKALVAAGEAWAARELGLDLKVGKAEMSSWRRELSFGRRDICFGGPWKQGKSGGACTSGGTCKSGGAYKSGGACKSGGGSCLNDVWGTSLLCRELSK